MLKSGSWKTVQFRRYNIDVPPTRVPLGRGNPYCTFLARLKDKLASLGFEEFDGPLVETEFWNGDALFMPQFHAARDIHDVYYIKEPDAREEHRAAVAGPGGRHARERLEDRQPRLGVQLRPGLHPAADPAQPGNGALRQDAAARKGAGQVLRRGALLPLRPVDATHLADFYQTEGIVLGEEVNLRTLLGLLKMFAEEVAMAKEVKYVPGFFPFTEPSVEVHIRTPRWAGSSWAARGSSAPR